MIKGLALFMRFKKWPPPVMHQFPGKHCLIEEAWALSKWRACLQQQQDVTHGLTMALQKDSSAFHVQSVGKQGNSFPGSFHRNGALFCCINPFLQHFAGRNKAGLSPSEVAITVWGHKAGMICGSHSISAMRGKHCRPPEAPEAQQGLE